MAFPGGKPFQAGEDPRRRGSNMGVGTQPTSAIYMRQAEQLLEKGARSAPELRELLRAMLAQYGIPRLLEIIQDRRARTADALKAIELIARVGVGEKSEVETRNLNASVDLSSSLARAFYFSNPEFRRYFDDNPDLRDKFLPAPPAEAQAHAE